METADVEDWDVYPIDVSQFVKVRAVLLVGRATPSPPRCLLRTRYLPSSCPPSSFPLFPPIIH
eukprot:351651-Chlamydomonas_euryale.AAC.7